MAWQNLPGDLKLEIFSRLPPKSLLRFRCVCKHWLSLFSNPSFINKHLHRTTTSAVYDDGETLLLHSWALGSAPHRLSLLNLKNPKNPLTFDILSQPFPQKNHLCDMDLVGSINGLVCLSSRIDGLISILWNPATKQYVNIPTPNLKFLPNQGGTSIGFCFDSLTNDYKIVRVVCFLEDMGLRPRVELYSVSTDCWREIEVEVSFDLLSSKCDTIVKGEPYWSAYFHGDPYGVAVWFDAGKEVFREGPELDVPEPYVGSLVNFEDSVAMLTSAFRSPEGELEYEICLFVMEDDSSSWRMKFSAGPSAPGSTTLVGCSKNGVIIQFPFEEHVMQLYNPKTQETSNILIDLEGLSIFQVSNYTASLVPLPIRGSKQVEKEGTSSKRMKIEDQVA